MRATWRSCAILVGLALSFSGAVSAQILSSSPLSTGAIGENYYYSLSGSSIVSWSIAGGSLPAGLSMDSTGFISGMPTVAGTATFTVSAQDSLGTIYTKAFALTINPRLAISSPLILPPVTVGGNYPPYTLHAVNGVPSYYWQGTLPANMTLDPYTGIISGVPAAAGSFSFPITVSDSSETGVTSTFRLTVNPPLSTTDIVLPNGVVSQTYSQPLTAKGGTAPYTWSSAGGTIPPGLTLPSTGTLSGTPTTPGNYVFFVFVQDAFNGRSTGQVTVTITAAGGPRIITENLLDGNVGQAYSQILAATDGKPPYTWAQLTGALPDGLHFASGTISGTPTLAGAFTVSFAVTDSAKASASRTFRITISAAPLSITTASLPNGTAGTSYSQMLAANGGTPPYTWGLDSGSLPSPLALDPQSGLISGTPAASGTSSISVRVTDSKQVTITKALQLKVGVPALPPADVTGVPDTLPPAQQNGVQVHLANQYPLPISGAINLAFAPAVVNGDDPAVQFSSGGRSASFTVPAGATNAVFGDAGISLQTGTVAGTITLTLQFSASGEDITPTPAPTRTIELPALAPVITKVNIARTATGIEVSVTGFSNTRDMSSATFSFPAAAGTNLATSQVTIPASPLFTPYYADAGSVAFGSLFTYVQPFTIQGTATDVRQVGVVLTNSVGASAAVTTSVP